MHRQIKDDQVNRMLRLQHLFHERYLTAQLLNELVATYVEAIECFDGYYAPMRKYFLEKIQFVVSQPEIDSMLKRNAEGDNNMVGALRETIRMTTDNTKLGKTQEIFSHAILMQAIEAQQKKSRQLHEKNQRAMKQKQKQSNSNNTNNFYMKSPEKQVQIGQQQKAYDRDKKIEMQMNLMKQVSENMKNLQMEVQKQNKNFMKKTKRINALMEEQNNSLQARLAMRKRGKGRKKSGDERFVQEVKEVIPVINKEKLKEAQKEIADAVERMTARLTQQQQSRMGTNKGATGMIVGNDNVNGEKYRGRIKVRNQVRQQEDEDDSQQEKGNIKKNNDKNRRVQQKKGQQMNFQQQKQQPQQQATQGTARFTLGNEAGGRGRIKRRDTNRLDDDDDDQQE